MFQTRQCESMAHGEPIPARLAGKTPLFAVPARLPRILNRDLNAAGIAKLDDRGRTLDIHALRATFETLLNTGGVAPHSTSSHAAQ